jgi:hypothetical protein
VNTSLEIGQCISGTINNNQLLKRNNMKPFNLQAAIAGAPIQYGDKRALKFVAYLPEANFDFRLVMLSSAGNVVSTNENPKHIFMTPVVKTYWFNVCTGKSGVPYFGNPFESEADATNYLNSVDDYIKTISIEVEE